MAVSRHTPQVLARTPLSTCTQHTSQNIDLSIRDEESHAANQVTASMHTRHHACLSLIKMEKRLLKNRVIDF